MLLALVQVSAVAQMNFSFDRMGHAKAAAMTGARPHQHAISVTSHCLLPGRNSRKTVVSRTRLPPAPKLGNQDD